jgi:hypothetical protein
VQVWVGWVRKPAAAYMTAGAGAALQPACSSAGSRVWVELCIKHPAITWAGTLSCLQPDELYGLTISVFSFLSSALLHTSTAHPHPGLVDPLGPGAVLKQLASQCALVGGQLVAQHGGGSPAGGAVQAGGVLPA